MTSSTIILMMKKFNRNRQKMLLVIPNMKSIRIWWMMKISILLQMVVRKGIQIDKIPIHPLSSPNRVFRPNKFQIEELSRLMTNRIHYFYPLWTNVWIRTNYKILIRFGWFICCWIFTFWTRNLLETKIRILHFELKIVDFIL